MAGNRLMKGIIMKRNSAAERRDRRRFIKYLLAVIPGAVTMAPSVKAVPAVPDSSAPDSVDDSGKGYQETLHIKKYYEKARF